MIDQSSGVEVHHTRRISLLLTLIHGSTLDSCNRKDILLMIGFNYNLTYTTGSSDLTICILSDTPMAIFLIRL